MRFTLTGAAFTLAALFPFASRADVVTDWNKTTVDEIRKLGLGPNPATRSLAIAHIAAFEAVNAITKTHEPYHTALEPALPASTDAAAASAFHAALVLLFPAEKSALDAVYAQSLASIPDGVAKTHGVQLGQAAAVDIFTLRVGDGSAASTTYPGSTDFGAWRPTPRADGVSAPLAALEPWWAQVKPFGLTKPDQFRPPAPPNITSAEFATAYLETKRLGKIDSVDRTPEQTTIANFWKQATHVPFNAIARSVSKAKHLSLDENARLFALLNITLADTRIAVWDAKYQYGYWRPATAINTLDDYGNAAAVPDADWKPLLETPNHPECPSGHSTTGGGAARLLAAVLGGDAVEFAVGSDTLPGATRGFSKLSDAEQENANSRIYGGIHYRFSNDAGIALGHQVADYVVANALKPVSPVTGAAGAGGEPGTGDAGATSTGGSASGGTAGIGAGGVEAGGAAGEAGSPSSGGKSGSGGSGGSGGGKAGSGGGTAQAPDDSENSTCSIGGPGAPLGTFASVLALGAVFLAWRRRRGA